MSTAFLCDVCEGFEAGKPVRTVTITPTAAPSMKRELELCTECLIELDTVLGIETQPGDES